jgi:regulator of sigma E protease
MIIQILAVVFVFFVLVMIHELGHFMAAKLMGVRVEKFSIGFSPTIWSKKIGETEYAIGMIPLGGFVKMSGMLDESMDTEIKGEPWEFDSKPAMARIFILSGGVLMNLILALLLMWGIFFVEGKKVHEPVVGRVFPETIASEIGLKPNDVIVGISDEKIEYYEDFLNRFMDAFKEGAVVWVNRNGKKTALNVPSDILERNAPTNLGFTLRRPTVISVVDTTKPAGKIGLMPGDVIVAVNNDTLHYWYQLDPLIRPHPGKKIKLSWLRNGRLMSDSLVIATIEYEDEEGFLKQFGQIGVGFAPLPTKLIKIGFFPALNEAVKESYNFLKQNIVGLGMMLSGRTRAQDSVGGIITIAAVTGSVAKTGFANLLMLLAQLSLILAFFNILPLPVLDGGHIAIIIVEAIRGKPLSVKIKMNIQKYGMIFLLLLIVAVFYIDIMRFFG